MNSILRHRVHELSGDATLSLHQIVARLRSTCPKYSRYKLQPFTLMVKKILDSSNNNKGKRKSTSNNDSTTRGPLSKKSKKIDGKEQRIDPQSESESSESYRSAVLATEDEVYGLQFEPEFDLTKSMLRNKYSGWSKINGKIDEKPKHMELEVVNNSNNKETKKVDVMKEFKVRKANDDGFDANRKDDWPMFKDLGGIDNVLLELKMKVLFPLFHPEIFRFFGVRPSAGILLHGPPGCGKTTLAQAIANETGLPFYKLSATELVSGISGASEENIRNLFSKAYKTAPSIVFIDEIDSIASKRENLQREMELRIVTQLMTCMDESHKIAKPNDTPKNVEKTSDGKLSGYVLVIGATNRPDAIDPALRRPGRFDREITLGVPDENARVQILSLLTRDLKLDPDFNLVKISRSAPGFVGTDLAALVNESVNLAMERIIKENTDIIQNGDWWREAWTPEIENFIITMSDFEVAAKLVQPSSRREGFSSIPNVKWEDIGGHDMLRREFNRYIVRRIKYPNLHKKYGIDLETGFLLYGPPGCGKTLIAKAVARESGANFIHIKGPELLNRYVGESESKVRTIFSRARTCSPCILFFDEVDALTTKRGNEGGRVVEGIVNQLLLELDGADERKGVYVIGATNRPEVMDPAFLRPGRLGKLLYVPLPNEEERGMILKALARNKPLGADVDLIAIGRSEACAHLSGADLCALINEAAMAAEDEEVMKLEAANEGISVSPSPESQHAINAIHFEQVLAKIKPSVSDEQKQYYQLLSKRFKST